MCLEMLQSNVSLEEFIFYPLDHEGNNDVALKKELYLRLNYRGRKFVQCRDMSKSAVPKGAWVDQLSKHMDDLDGLFYYISANPPLCQVMPEDSACSILKQTNNGLVFDEDNDQSPNGEEAASEEY